MFKKADLQELKCLSCPPELVKTVLGTTMRLLGYSKADSQDWAKIKKRLASADFLKQCEELSSDKMPEEVKADVRETLKDVTVGRAKAVSSAIASVYTWDLTQQREQRMFQKKDLQELKCLSSPPELVITVLGTTMQLLGYSKADSQDWAKIKKRLASADFLKQCEELSSDKMPEEVKADVRETLKDVTVGRAKAVSSAIASVYTWDPTQQREQRMFKKSDIQVLKSMANPPELVKTVLGTTMRLLGYSKADSKDWVKIKKRIDSADFLKQCEDLSSDKMPEEVKAEVRETLKDVTREQASKVACAIASVYTWNMSLVN